MIFTIVFVHTYHRYGILLYTRTDSHFCWQYLAHNCSCIKQLAWLLAVVQTFLTLASCKHFTVDVFVSWLKGLDLVLNLIPWKLSDRFGLFNASAGIL
jgi:hypothetical protein